MKENKFNKICGFWIVYYSLVMNNIFSRQTALSVDRNVVLNYIKVPKHFGRFDKAVLFLWFYTFFVCADGGVHYAASTLASGLGRIVAPGRKLDFHVSWVLSSRFTIHRESCFIYFKQICTEINTMYMVIFQALYLKTIVSKNEFELIVRSCWMWHCSVYKT